MTSQRAGGKAPPDDRLREAIEMGWIASPLTLLTM